MQSICEVSDEEMTHICDVLVYSSGYECCCQNAPPKNSSERVPPSENTWNNDFLALADILGSILLMVRDAGTYRNQSWTKGTWSQKTLRQFFICNTLSWLKTSLPAYLQGMLFWASCGCYSLRAVKKYGVSSFPQLSMRLVEGPKDLKLQILKNHQLASHLLIQFSPISVWHHLFYHLFNITESLYSAIKNCVSLV